jgi:apolipoprotein N-acyltransferase
LLGTLTSFSLPPYNYYVINFLTFSLFFIFIFNKKKNIRNNLSFFKYGWFFGFGYFLSSLYWISISLTFDQSFKYLLPIALILVPSFLAIFYGLITLLFSIFFSKKITTTFLMFSIIFGTIEIIRGFIFTGFPWNLVAYSFSENTYFLQILSVIGTYSFNLLCISVFTCPALFFLKKTKRELFLGSFFILVSVSLIIFGFIKNNQFNLIETNKNDYIIRIVSPNIEINRFYSNKYEADILNELIDLSSPQADKPTIFLWPEGTITDTYLSDIKIYENLISKKFSKNHFLIFGINTLEFSNGKDLYFNSMAVFDNKLNLLSSYNKVNLVPFGEFLPLENILNSIGIKTVTNNYQSYSEGLERKPITIQDKKINLTFLPLICYEIIYSGKIFKDANFDYIINISEDGWFGRSIGPYQHFAHGIFRSIESGKYTIRAANNGISAIINPLGIIDEKIKFGETGYIDFIESKTTKLTIFSLYGNKIFIILILLYIFLIFSFNSFKNE